jgi:hypothetical protein
MVGIGHINKPTAASNTRKKKGSLAAPLVSAVLCGFDYPVFKLSVTLGQFLTFQAQADDFFF